MKRLYEKASIRQACACASPSARGSCVDCGRFYFMEESYHVVPSHGPVCSRCYMKVVGAPVKRQYGDSTS